ncbi:hypothetical protein [Streptomyces roseirectus]|uniref:hypothetical protein n=1 Tax=Streptomyces roseirectus TaxID=2768066 RepID=UPI001FEC3C29|nr:hypothetical protein [Streptomyces roseirectus]
MGLGWEQDRDGWESAGRSARWAATCDAWQRERDKEVRAAEEAEKRRRLSGVPAALDGKEIMELPALPPGPLIGAATRRLQELHLERGPLPRDEAVRLLRRWAADV